MGSGTGVSGFAVGKASLSARRAASRRQMLVDTYSRSGKNVNQLELSVSYRRDESQLMLSY
jgi:hypothetical protein